MRTADDRKDIESMGCNITMAMYKTPPAFPLNSELPSPHPLFFFI